MAAYSGLFPFLISISCYFLIGPFLILILLINRLIRFLVSYYLYLKYDDEVILVPDGCDAIWTAENKTSKTAVVGARFRGHLKEETLLKILDNKVRFDADDNGDLINGKLEHILVKKMGYACWKLDNNFDLRNHVRCFPESDILDRKELEKLIELLSEDMPPAKPQWEFIIVSRYLDGEDGGESGWILFRFNHSYCDGLSVLMFIKRYLFPNLDFFVDPTKFKIPFRRKLLFYLNAILFGPYAALCHFKSKISWPKVNCQNGNKRSFRWTESISLDNISFIRKTTNTTTSAVLENAFISAVIQVLPSNRIPNEWVISEMAALLPYPNQKLRNCFSSFNYSIASEDDDFTRLRKMKKAVWEGMTGPSILLFYALAKVIGKLPVFLHPRLLAGPKSTISFSNVPTSKTPLDGVDNIKVLEFLGFPSQANSGITLCSTSYVNSVRIAASAKADWLDESELEEIMKRIPNIIEAWVGMGKTAIYL